MSKVKIGFVLSCKVCGKILEEKENPLEHIAEHDAMNYFDLVPTVPMKE